MSTIEINKLSFSYGNGREVLSDVKFRAEGRESIGLIGANGVGKSTLLKLLVGLLDGAQGCVTVDGMEVKKKNLAAIRESTGYVFQDSESQLFLNTVYEDVAFGPKNYGYPEEEVRKRTMDALQKVHLEELCNRQIYRMSGGQKKLASIATVLSMDPGIVLLDEPSVALDPRNRRNLIQILKDMKVLKIIATHDLDLVLDTCERTVLLSDGRIVKDGGTEEILRDRELLEQNGLELPLSLSGR